MRKKPNTRESKILETITPSDALAILRLLAEDTEMTKRIDDVAMEFLSEVQVGEISAQVQMELEFLDVEDVWGRSGPTEHGYIDPGDAAWEIFEEAMQPFQEEVQKYQRLAMYDQAKLFCMGILKGIYEFDKESTTEYKQWAVDAPGEFFAVVLDDWSKSSTKVRDRTEMRKFIEADCPDWGQWALRSLQSRRTT